MRDVPLAVLTAVSLLAACGGSTPDPVSTVAAGPPFVWDAFGPGTLHLVGRVWAACSQDMPTSALASVASSSTFVMLSDPPEEKIVTDPDLENIFRGLTFLARPHTLHDDLSDDEVSKLRALAGPLPWDVVSERPGAVVRYVVEGHHCTRRARRPDIYREAAVQAGKKIVGLFPADRLPELIDDAHDLTELKPMIADRELPSRELSLWMVALRAGDENAFVGITPPLQTHLSEHRVGFLKRLDDLAKQGETFVELPVSELVGPTGILAGLQKLGYTVTRRP